VRAGGDEKRCSSIAAFIRQVRSGSITGPAHWGILLVVMALILIGGFVADDGPRDAILCAVKVPARR
jgi:hypothetical protein